MHPKSTVLGLYIHNETTKLFRHGPARTFILFTSEK